MPLTEQLLSWILPIGSSFYTRLEAERCIIVPLSPLSVRLLLVSKNRNHINLIRMENIDPKAYSKVANFETLKAFPFQRSDGSVCDSHPRPLVVSRII